MITVRYFCLIDDVIAILYGLPKDIRCTFTASFFFMYLFTIPSQTVIGKILSNLWQKVLEKPLWFSHFAVTGFRYTLPNHCIQMERNYSKNVYWMSFLCVQIGRYFFFFLQLLLCNFTWKVYSMAIDYAI